MGLTLEHAYVPIGSQLVIGHNVGALMYVPLLFFTSSAHDGLFCVNDPGAGISCILWEVI